MIILDTNVVSEPWRPKPNSLVLAWLESQPASTLYLCAPVLAELRHGLDRLQTGRRRARLQAAVERVEREGYRDRILPFGLAAAVEFGRAVALRERLGRRIRTMDAMIASVALAHRASLATRDAADFADLGIDVINPFEPTV